MKRDFAANILAAGVLTAAMVLVQPAARAADILTLTSPAYQDNAMLDVKNAGNLKDMPSCPADAGTVSPPLAWSNAPDTAKSFALTIVDPEGGGGAGFIHMVIYGIPASVTGFAEGELSKPSDKFIGGKNSKDMATYFGPCPPRGVRRAPLRLYPYRHRPRPEGAGAEARHDARRTACGAEGPRQEHGRPRLALQAPVAFRLPRPAAEAWRRVSKRVQLCTAKNAYVESKLT